MSPERIDEVLKGPLQAILAVNRANKGPLAIPMSYVFEGHRFVMVTSPDTLHGRLMLRQGRGTITVQYEACDGRSVYQWYVIAEGPVRFTEENPRPFVRRILIKDRGEANAGEWTARMGADDDTVAELVPERISGFEARASLD